MAKLPDGRALPGKLFIVEGIDGSGKSTQLDLRRKWLIGQGYCVAFSEWNSSPLVKETTKKGKKKLMMTPASFSLIHAADMADRLERQILPALRAGAIVLADRYIYTAFGRDVARGIPPTWVRKVYSFAVEPTVAFYFRVPLEESLNRILGGRPKLKFYEAGLDIGLSDDPYESFALFPGPHPGRVRKDGRRVRSYGHRCNPTSGEATGTGSRSHQAPAQGRAARGTQCLARGIGQ